VASKYPWSAESGVQDGTTATAQTSPHCPLGRAQDLLTTTTCPEGGPMHLMRRLRHHGTRPATIAACAIAAVLLVPQGADAAGTNWAQYSGNCYGWTTWNANSVAGHVWDHANDDCQIGIFQYKSNESSEWPDSSAVADATKINTGASTPTWYYGPASSGGALYTYVCVTDFTTNSAPECITYY
jgi:hypothetical protein